MIYWIVISLLFIFYLVLISKGAEKLHCREEDTLQRCDILGSLKESDSKDI